MRENGNGRTLITPATSKILAAISLVGVMVVVLVLAAVFRSLSLDSSRGSAGGSGTNQAAELS